MDYDLSQITRASERLPVISPGDDIDRPRERLWTMGVDRVDDVDLLALVLGTGTRGRSAAVLAAQLLQKFGGLGGLPRAAPHDLAQLDGIGPAQAARVVAAVNIGMRALEQCRHPLPDLGCAADVRRRLWPRLVDLEQEAFFVLAIDVRNKILAEIEIARGHLTGVEVHPREVFRPLIRAAAAAGVCVHNHPSGDPTPSPEDLLLTKRLREAGVLVGIPLIDHVVIAERGYVSISEWLAGNKRIGHNGRYEEVID